MGNGMRKEKKNEKLGGGGKKIMGEK